MVITDLTKVKLSSNVYDTIKAFQNGFSAIEEELVARWSGLKSTEVERLESLQHMVCCLHSLVGKEFIQSPYGSLHDTLSSPPKLNARTIDELDLFHMIKYLGDENWTFTPLGKMLVTYMHDEYVVGMQPKAAVPRVPGRERLAPKAE